jgi:elongation factor Ts
MTELKISASQVKELRDKTGAGMGACKKALVETAGDVEAAVDVLRKKGVKPDQASRTAAEGAVLFKVSDCAKHVAVVELRCETDFAARNENFQALLNTIADTVLEKKIENTEAAKADETIAAGIQQAAAMTIRENIVLGEASLRSLEGEGKIGVYVHHNSKLGVAVAVNTTTDVAANADLDALLKDLAMHATAHHPAPVSVSKDGVPEDLVAREKALALAVIDEDPKLASKPDNIKEKMVTGKLRKFFEERALLEQKFVKDPSQKVSDLVAKASKDLGGEISIAWFVRRGVGE